MRSHRLQFASCPLRAATAAIARARSRSSAAVCSFVWTQCAATGDISIAVSEAAAQPGVRLLDHIPVAVKQEVLEESPVGERGGCGGGRHIEALHARVRPQQVQHVLAHILRAIVFGT